MRIVDAEPQLVTEILEEIEVIERREKQFYTIYIGHHPALGRIAVIEAKEGQGALIEME